MDFNENICTIERTVSGFKLAEKLQNRMLDYPVAVVIIGGTDKVQKEFVKWLQARVQIDWKQWFDMESLAQANHFSKTNINTGRGIDIVTLNGQVGVNHVARRTIITEFRKECEQVMLIWLRPRRKTKWMVVRGDIRIDEAIANDETVRDEVDYFTTLYYD